MKVLACLLLVVAGLLAGCRHSHNSLLQGSWKVNRVELHKDQLLQRTIAADFQCWQIYNGDSIVITDTPHLRNLLHVHRRRSKLIHFQPGSGETIDEYKIDKLSKTMLQLSSHKVIDRSEYTIKYFLEKDTVTRQ